MKKENKDEVVTNHLMKYFGTRNRDSFSQERPNHSDSDLSLGTVREHKDKTITEGEKQFVRERVQSAKDKGHIINYNTISVPYVKAYAEYDELVNLYTKKPPKKRKKISKADMRH